MVLTTPVKSACILSAKIAYGPVHARLCNGTEASLPWKLFRTYLESCASIVQALVCRPLLLPSCSLDQTRRPTLFAQVGLLQKISKIPKYDSSWNLVSGKKPRAQVSFSKNDPGTDVIIIIIMIRFQTSHTKAKSSGDDDCLCYLQQ